VLRCKLYLDVSAKLSFHTRVGAKGFYTLLDALTLCVPACPLVAALITHLESSHFNVPLQYVCMYVCMYVHSRPLYVNLYVATLTFVELMNILTPIYP
jgi:hypothetical protein